MKNIKYSGMPISAEDIAKFDIRIQEAMKHWKVVMIHKGSEVHIPGTWGAEIYPTRYYEIYKNLGDVNPGEDENEISAYLSCGWVGCDDEVVITLNLLGYSALDPEGEVSAEIYKFGADKCKVYYRDKLVTNFTEKFLYFFKRDISKAYATSLK